MDDADIAELTRAFLDRHFAESPELATMNGLDGLDDRLPALGADDIVRRAREDDEWDERFAAIADDALSAEERVDRDLVRSLLRGRQILHEWQDWRRLPDTYAQPGLTGLFALFLRRLHPEPELVRSARARLDAIPALLDAGRANLDPELVRAPIAGRGVNLCRAAAGYVRELVPAEVADDAGRAELAEAGARAAEAYGAFGAHLTDLQERATGTWEVDERRYTALLRDKELLDFDAAALRERGAAAYDELATEMRELARRHWATDDSRSVLRELADHRPQTPEEMRLGYEQATERAHQFLIQNGLVTLPDGEHCDVVPSPPFLRPVLAVASYQRPPVFRSSCTGRFNVPFPPDGTPPDEVAQRLATNCYAEMPTVSVHEAYPGHHWHFVRLRAIHAEDRPLRCILTTPYLSEGWALYAELMMREQGFFTDPAHELAHLDARLFRAARIVVDTSLHCGDMGFDEAVTFMRDRAGLTEPVARAEVTRYCAWPTQASAYLTGSFEIERLRQRWFDEQAGDLLTFHDTLCGSAALPIALAERTLFPA
ncbi:MAG: DUF885 domain-containing protein [Acidimicrobiales bacterium]